MKTTKDDGRCVTCGKPEWYLGVCQACYMRRWRLYRLPPLPKHVLERHAFPYREWWPAETTYTNVAHCIAQIRTESGWSPVALCDWRISVSEILTFQATPRPCRRCVTILTRVDVLEERDVVVKTA